MTLNDLLPHAERAASLLKARKETVAVAESSAGGLISAALLAMPGASAYYVGGAVNYTRPVLLHLSGRGADELAKLAATGDILDIGIQLVDCIGEKDGKPHTIHHSVVGPDIKRVNELIPGATSVSYGTSTPASIYAEFILDGRIAEPGVIAPELLDRAVRDAFIAEMGRREMIVTRKDVRQVN